ncbi:MAG: T9SS type A sorting domain-containing protein [Bacteroidales bacterium]|nr:T9SS type A sorting domain-containing protein [Bacteroidales bacterium]
MYQIRIFNATGKEAIRHRDQTSQVDISKLPAGIYFISARDDYGRFYSQKFVKQ